ncbi:hypothetical protein D9M70_380860 [compost metagenome]
MSVPVAALKISPDRCGDPPVPELANDSLPGCALASVTSSFAVLAGSLGVTTSTNGSSAISVIGTRRLGS